LEFGILMSPKFVDECLEIGNPGSLVLSSSMELFIAKLIAGLVAAAGVFGADLRRRRLSLARRAGWHALSALDLLCTALTAGAIAIVAVMLLPIAEAQQILPLWSPITWRIAAGTLILAVIWTEGKRQIQFQRPQGIVFGEWLIMFGGYQLLESVFFRSAASAAQGRLLEIMNILAVLTGSALIAMTVPRFMKKYEGHRILDRISEQGESVQPEYSAPTPECPRPELWKMVDSQTTELEVVDFLNSLVCTVKPDLVVETGTFLAYSAIKMAQGLKSNGFGKIITIEYDPAIFAKAKERIEASGFAEWIEYRNESSLETRIEGKIDLLFSDSRLANREQEIRRFLPQINPAGLIVIHDASSRIGVVREAALRLEQEGLLSIIFLPTPRGVVIAQKRVGRI
jgi:predicted O-methyltransferase YrrM